MWGVDQYPAAAAVTTPSVQRGRWISHSAASGSDLKRRRRASLSAILMDEGYYGLVLQTRYVDDGIPMVAVEGLIPLKAKAWLDLQARRGAGQHVDEDDIKKHRNDVFRLALTLTGEPVEIAQAIRTDLAAFLAAFPDGTADWPSIASALQATMGAKTRLSLPDLRQAIAVYFRLE